MNLCRNQNIFLTFENVAAALLLLSCCYSWQLFQNIVLMWPQFEGTPITLPIHLALIFFILVERPYLGNVLLSLSLINHHHTHEDSTGQENKLYLSPIKDSRNLSHQHTLLHEMVQNMSSSHGYNPIKGILTQSDRTSELQFSSIGGVLNFRLYNYEKVSTFPSSFSALVAGRIAVMKFSGLSLALLSVWRRPSLQKPNWDLFWQC